MALISVLIPTRNAERFIGATLESVLGQTGVELEVVLVDDGSTDRSVEIAKGMEDERVRVVPGPRRGISAAFNAGVAAAKGEIITRCDADDLYPAGRLAWQVKFLSEHPEFGAVCGYFSTITEAGKAVVDSYLGEPAGEVTEELKRGVGRSHMCAYAFRTDVLRRVGGCREWFVTSEDRDLQYRLAEVTRIWFEPRPTYLYRLHNQSITHTQKLAERGFYESMAKTFQEQRRGGAKDDLERGEPPVVKVDGVRVLPQSAGEQIRDLLLGQAWKMHRAGMKGKAIGLGWRACVGSPGSVTAWRSFGALVLKSAGTAKPQAENDRC